MDISDYTRILFDKIQKFEPEYVAKIIGYLLLQDNGEEKMVKLASCDDHFIREVASKAKIDLQGLAAKPVILPISHPINPQQGLCHSSVISPRAPTSPPSFQSPSPYWDPHSASNTDPKFMAVNYLDSMTESQNQAQLFSLENHIEPVNTETGGIARDYFGLDACAANLGAKAGRRLSSLSEFPAKTCHYFNKGFCMDGTTSTYHHGQVVSNSFPHMYGNNAINEDHMLSPGSLVQLETEIVELLKTRRGSPMSIALLPTAYYDKYKKVLQADGYLAESQRHGKSGYSLTKLLARLKNSIQLIDRPHGQHEVVLAEDAPKYIQQGDCDQNISAPRKIYLTFPAESDFTEEDVSNYFNKFGCVEDVRIPYQQRRMFGFVIFVDPETVKTILKRGNPHYVSGSRVLVKPYRMKAKVVDMKFPVRNEPLICYSPQYVDTESEFPSTKSSCGNQKLAGRQLIEEEQAFESQRRHFAQLQLAQNPFSSSPQFSFSLDDTFNFPPAESVSNALNEEPGQTDNNSSDDENRSQGLDLPDSLFAFLTENGI